MSVIYTITNPGGKLILSYFHPIGKIINVHGDGKVKEEMDYFTKEILEGEMAHARFYDDEKRKKFPKSLIRMYTLGEIINSVLTIGFILTGFFEHPSWINKKLPGEFIILAFKPG